MACCSQLTIWRTIAGFSMLLSLILAVASICGLLSYYCMFPSTDTFIMDNAYFTYVLYFYNHDCVTEKSDFIVWKSNPSEMMWKWVVAYLVINLIWFFTSILLMVAPVHWRTRTTLWMTYPWLFVTFGVLSMDVAASVTYGMDYSNIETLDMLFDYIMLAYPKKTDAVKAGFAYIPVPTIITVGVFSKLIIGWLLVFFSFFTILILLSRVSRPKALYLQTHTPFDYYAPPVVNPSFEGETAEVDEFVLSRQARPGSPRSDDDARHLWEHSPYQSTPHILPRVTLRPIVTRNDSVLSHEGRDVRHEPPADNRYFHDGVRANQPWSYLPSQPLHAPTKSEPTVKFALDEPDQSRHEHSRHYTNHAFDDAYI